MSVRIRYNEILPNLERLADDDEAKEAIQVVLEYWATQAMSIMKSGARWTDQTGVARQGLLAKAFKEGDGSVLVLWSQAPYGIWLEVRWSGKYAIVGPTLRTIAPAVLQMAGEAVMRMADS
jgi:hypothetical protein